MEKKMMALMLAGCMILPGGFTAFAEEAVAVETVDLHKTQAEEESVYPWYGEQPIYEKEGIKLTVYAIAKTEDSYFISFRVDNDTEEKIAVLDTKQMINEKEIYSFAYETSEEIEQEWIETRQWIEDAMKDFQVEESVIDNEVERSLGVPQEEDGQEVIRVSIPQLFMEDVLSEQDVIDTIYVAFTIYNLETFEILDLTDPLEIQLPVQEAFGEAFEKETEEFDENDIENDCGITATDSITVTGVKDLSDGDYEVDVEKEMILSDKSGYFSPQDMHSGTELGAWLGREPIVFKDGAALWEDSYYSTLDEDVSVSGIYPLYKTQTIEESGLDVTIDDFCLDRENQYLRADIHETSGADFLLFYTLLDDSTGFEESGWSFVQQGEASVFLERISHHVSTDGLILVPDSVYLLSENKENLSFTVEEGEWEDDYGIYELEDKIIFDTPQTGVGMVTTIAKDTGERTTTVYTILDSDKLSITRYGYAFQYASLEELPVCEVETVSIIAPDAVLYYHGPSSTVEEVYQAYKEKTDAEAEETVIETDVENGSEEFTPAEETVSTEAVQIDAEIIQKVQQKLNDLGFDCGTPDGIAGERTYAAIEHYQESNGLSVTGAIDMELLEKLGIN